MIRVALPTHLRTLAQVQGEVKLNVEGRATQRSVLDALEAKYPMLRGTIRDHVTQKRRPFLRFFACEQDLSHELPDAPLPDEVASGSEPYLVVGAVAAVSLTRENGRATSSLARIRLPLTLKLKFGGATCAPPGLRLLRLCSEPFFLLPEFRR